MKLAAKMVKAIHAQKRKKALHEKSKIAAGVLRAMKLKEAAMKFEDGVEEILPYCTFPISLGRKSAPITH